MKFRRAKKQWQQLLSSWNLPLAWCWRNQLQELNKTRSDLDVEKWLNGESQGCESDTGRAWDPEYLAVSLPTLWIPPYIPGFQWLVYPGQTQRPGEVGNRPSVRSVFGRSCSKIRQIFESCFLENISQVHRDPAWRCAQLNQRERIWTFRDKITIGQLDEQYSFTLLFNFKFSMLVIWFIIEIWNFLRKFIHGTGNPYQFFILILNAIKICNLLIIKLL